MDVLPALIVVEVVSCLHNNALIKQRKLVRLHTRLVAPTRAGLSAKKLTGCALLSQRHRQRTVVFKHVFHLSRTHTGVTIVHQYDVIIASVISRHRSDGEVVALLDNFNLVFGVLVFEEHLEHFLSEYVSLSGLLNDLLASDPLI